MTEIIRINIITSPEQNPTQNIELVEFIKFTRKKKLIHIIGLSIRPGVKLFNSALEHIHFKPGTDLNHKFILHLITWQNILWIVNSIPHTYLKDADEVATSCGLKLRKSIPLLTDSKQIRRFPIQHSERVYTLENIPGHRVYLNNPEIKERLERQEMEKIGEIVKAHHHK